MFSRTPEQTLARLRRVKGAGAFKLYCADCFDITSTEAGKRFEELLRYLYIEAFAEYLELKDYVCPSPTVKLTWKALKRHEEYQYALSFVFDPESQRYNTCYPVNPWEDLYAEDALERYKNTKRLYKKLFREAPPRSIWPNPPEQDRPITIYGKMINGQTQAFTINSHATTLDLKRKIQAEFYSGIPLSEIRIIFGGKQFADDKTLAEQGLRDHCIFYVALRLR